MLSISLIQFSIEEQGCVLSLLLDLRSDYGGGSEDNGDLLQKVPHRHCYRSLQQAAADPHLHWRFLYTPGKSGPVSHEVTAPFS